MQQKTKELLKAEILSAVSEEIDQWLAIESHIKDGYEYEEQFLAAARKINHVLLQKSMGSLPGSKNEKKTSYLCGRSYSKQNACAKPTHIQVWN